MTLRRAELQREALRQLEDEMDQVVLDAGKLAVTRVGGSYMVTLSITADPRALGEMLTRWGAVRRGEVDLAQLERRGERLTR